MPRKPAKLLFTALFLLSLLFFLPARQKTAAASPSTFSEEQIKAAYIYNFAKFIQWPESAFADTEAPLQICVAGPESVYLALESLENKTVQGRPLKTSRHSSTGEPRKCHILFIGKENKKEFWEKKEKSITPHVLTIADFDSFVSQGGIIELLQEGSKIRFAVNIRAAERAELKLSSKLLKLAVFIQE